MYQFAAKEYFIGRSFSIITVLLFIGCFSDSDTPGNGPTPNPYLASSLYAITHFDSSQSDSTPYGPISYAASLQNRPAQFSIDLSTRPICYGGPINIITLASTDPNYMWQVSTDRVSYVYKGAGQWSTISTYPALAHASGNVYPAIPNASLRAFGLSSAVGMTTSTMDTYLQGLFGTNYADRFGNASYVLVDKNNVLYTNYGNTLYGFALTDPSNPSAGITIRYELDNIVTAIQGSSPPPPQGVRLFGLSMTYDGYLIVTFSNGVAVIDRALTLSTKSFYPFAATEYVSNSIAVDENNGIYVATGPLPVNGVTGIAIMRKLVWTGTTISDGASDGAWSCQYDSSLPELPPIIKIGYGTGLPRRSWVSETIPTSSW